MKSNREMREDAWGTLFARRWFFRLIAVSLLFFGINMTVQTAFSSACETVGVMTVNDYRTENRLAKLTGEAPPPKPTEAELPGILAATVFEYFILLIFAGIAAFGNARAELKAAREEEGDWLKEAMGGFARPFGMLALTFRLGLQVFLWTLLLVVPGIIALYRYRNAWFVKADHPDWSAGACLRESGHLMRGFKFRAFVFDLSYWKWILAVFASGLVLLTGVGVVAAGSLPAVAKFGGGLVIVLGLSLYLPTVVVLSLYMSVGRAVFYLGQLADEQPAEPLPPSEG